MRLERMVLILSLGGCGCALQAADATQCEFTSGLEAAGAPAAGPGGPVECWVDEPEGALPARATKTVTVTLFPRYRKRYSLQVRCRSSTVAPLLAGPNRPPSGGPNRPRSGAASSPSPASGPAPDDAAPPPVIAPLTANVTFPSLEVTDVFCEGVPKPLLWQLLGLNDLNNHLRSEVTATELRLRAAQDRGSLTTEAACAAMRPFPMEIGTHARGGPPRVVHVEISNPTPLPVTWQLHSFDDPHGVELENWVEPGRPQTEEQRMRDLIAERRLFEMRPRGGSLEPGARSTVTFEFRPEVPGAFQLPVFLHIDDGKRLRLQLQVRAWGVGFPALPLSWRARTQDPRSCGLQLHVPLTAPAAVLFHPCVLPRLGSQDACVDRLCDVQCRNKPHYCTLISD